MNDAEFERQRQRVTRLMSTWCKLLDLDTWLVKAAFVREDFENNGKPEPDTVATCDADWRYLRATISFNMPLCAEVSDETLEETVVHELLHIHVNETRETGDDWLGHEERTVTALARIVITLRKLAPAQAATAANGNVHVTTPTGTQWTTMSAGHAPDA